MNNNEKFIYLDNASTTWVYKECINEISNILSNNWGNPSNRYTIGFEAYDIIINSKIKIANALHCDPDEIFFTSGSSEGNAWALLQKDKCYCSPYEHHSITANNKSIIIDDKQLLQDYNDYTKSLKKKNKLIKKYNNNMYAHLYVSNITGEVFNVNYLFGLAHQLNMLTLCDMTQALGNIEINLHEMECDIATFSSHKVHGPKGCGFIYIKKSVQPSIIPLIPGTQQEELRGGTENTAFISATAIAVEKSNSEITYKRNLSAIYTSIILSELEKSKIEYIINSGKKNILSTLNISLKGIESEILQSMLSKKNIFIGVGSGCNNSLFEPDPTLVAMNVPEEYLHGQIRFSFSTLNTEEEVRIAIQELINCYKQLTE